MTRRSTDFYHAAIKSCHPYAFDIRQPIVAGVVGDVFLADVAPGKTYVYKFNDKPIVQRNYELCETLALIGAPVPRTTVHSYLQTSFEVYPYCTDKTLCEHMRTGMNDNHIFEIYCDVIRAQQKISQINKNEINLGQMASFYQVVNKNIRRASGSSLTHAYMAMLGVMSRVGPQFLLHNDIHMKNILITDEYKFSKMIDMDAISFCNEDFSVMQMLRAYPLDNVSELMDFYEDTMQRKLHRNLILNTVRVLSVIHSPKQQVERMLAGDMYHKR